MEKKANVSHTNLVEKTTYGTYFLGQNIFFSLFASFFIPFLTDIGIAVFAIAALSLIVRIFDAATDPVFGVIIDKVKFRKGKFGPWLRVAAFAVPFTTVLFFVIPADLSMTAKILWAGAAYILWSVVYTFSDAPLMGLVTTVTDRLAERTQLVSIGRFTSALAGILVMVVIGAAREVFGGWIAVALILSAIGFITMVPLSYVIRERFPPPPLEKSSGVRDTLAFVAKNKYLLILYVAFFIAMATSIGMTLTMYLARHNLGNEAMLMPVMLLSMTGPMIILSILLPALTQRFDKFHILLVGVIGTVVLNVISFFAGYTIPWVFYSLTLLRGVFFSMFFLPFFLFTPDCAEYGFYKAGKAMPGITFALQTFISKLMVAVMGAIGAVALGVIGFVEGEGAAQLAGFEDRLWFIYLIPPAIGALVSIPIFLKYKLRDKHVKVIMQCNQGEITREEAEKLLAGKI
ncbi:MAG: MFS transporter [Treponema sp.]|nr:MFS transporter [Treponema sp.]